MALARLDELQKVWHPKAVDGDPVAAQLVLDIHRQRAALLSLGRDAVRLRRARGTGRARGGGHRRTIRN